MERKAGVRLSYGPWWLWIEIQWETFGEFLRKERYGLIYGLKRSLRLPDERMDCSREEL